MLFDYVVTYRYMIIHLHPKYSYHYMNRKNLLERSYIIEHSWDTNHQLLREGIKYNLCIHLLREGIVIKSLWSSLTCV